MQTLEVETTSTSTRQGLARIRPLHPLQLDFHDTRRRTSWPNRTLLLGGILAVALLGYQFVQTQNNIGVLATKQTVLEQTTHQSAHQVRLTPEQAQNLRAEIKDAKAVLSQLNLPWGSLLQDIGASEQNQVALLSIVPDVPKRIIKISGEAKDLSAVLDYIQALQKARSLGSVYLQDHQIETRSAQQPVRFTLLATWMVKP